MQRTPETVKSVIVADKQSKSFHIALSVLKNTFDKDVITKALIDSGDVPRMRQRSVKIGDLSVNPMRF